MSGYEINFSQSEMDAECVECGHALRNHSSNYLNCPVDGQPLRFGFDYSREFYPKFPASELMEKLNKIDHYTRE